MMPDVLPPDSTTPSPSLEAEQDSPQVIEVLAECPNCGQSAILFSRTIQTFCYRCAMPVTQLDATGLYYRVIVPPADQATTAPTDA